MFSFQLQTFCHWLCLILKKWLAGLKKKKYRRFTDQQPLRRKITRKRSNRERFRGKFVPLCAVVALRLQSRFFFTLSRCLTSPIGYFIQKFPPSPSEQEFQSRNQFKLHNVAVKWILTFCLCLCLLKLKWKPTSWRQEVVLKSFQAVKKNISG